MKKILRWSSIQLICFSFFFPLSINRSICQQLWGMTSDGGSKKTGGNIFSINGDGTGFTERHAFFNDAEYPKSQRLLDYGDGYLYGAAQHMIFRHHYDGSDYEIVYTFPDAKMYPWTRLLKGLDGFLYGGTLEGGANDQGVIFKVKRNGTSYQVLHEFGSGTGPSSDLLQLNNGVIYGTTQFGGSFNLGMVYSINPDGTSFQKIHSFNGTHGSEPLGAVVPVTINNTLYLYGVTFKGGSNQGGVIYRIEPDGSNYSRKFNFSLSTGQYPARGIMKIGHTLYGGTLGGYPGGVVFSYNANSDTYQILHQFDYDPMDYSQESGPLCPFVNVNGVLYGTTEIGGYSHRGVLFKVNTDGTGYQVIYELAEGCFGNLLFANNQIYGLTNGHSYISGNPNTNLDTHGTIFRINPDGTSYQTIHTFDDSDGYGPSGSLIRGQDGKLYGLASYGGGDYSNGLAFSIETNGNKYTPLKWLANSYQDGNALGSMILASNGSFYGTISQGPTYSHNEGKIYQLTINPVFLLFQYYEPFCAGTGCSNDPVASLLQASDGNLYGMTPYAGADDTYGTIFRIGTNGSGFTILKQFNNSDGANPVGSLIQAPDGYLYGMTENGGVGDFGVIFKIKTDGTGFQKLFEFGSSAITFYGAHPKGKLLYGSDGNLYGMANQGGGNYGGTIFSINTSGTVYNRIFSFSSTTGRYPVSSLVEDPNTGYLFGMAEQGGTNGFGTIFKIKKDGSSFQKLLDFNGTNGKYPRGDLLIVNPTIITIPPILPTSASVQRSNPRENSFISVFPNPVKQSFTIRFPKQLSGRVVYSLKDLSGRKLMEKTIDRSAFTEIKSVDISSLPVGTYLLELSTPHEKFTQKIVKQ